MLLHTPHLNGTFVAVTAGCWRLNIEAYSVHIDLCTVQYNQQHNSSPQTEAGVIQPAQHSTGNKPTAKPLSVLCWSEISRSFPFQFDGRTEDSISFHFDKRRHILYTRRTQLDKLTCKHSLRVIFAVLLGQ